MAITLRKLIRDIQLIAASGPVPDDFRISDRQVEFWINNTREKLISQAIEKRNDISETWIQTIECLELEPVDVAECCDIELGCTILKSTLQLPDTIESRESNLIIGVTGLDNSPITQTNRFKSRYKKYSKYTANNKGWYLKDNYLYIINDELLARVTIHGIFSNPMDLANFRSCTNEPCFDYDSAYPVSGKMADDIVNIIIDTKVKKMLTFPQDSINDGENRGVNIIKE